MRKRNTLYKSEILDLLKRSKKALNHVMINDALDLKIDRTTIYRILNSFCEDGKVHKVIADDGKQYFAFCQSCDKVKQTHSHKHLHFRCLSCGIVECLPQKIAVDLPQNYEASNFNFLISGHCNSCTTTIE